MFSSLIQGIDDVVSWISAAFESFSGIFSDIDFTVLYSWLPSDISAAISVVIVALLFICLIQLVKKLVLFLG